MARLITKQWLNGFGRIWLYRLNSYKAKCPKLVASAVRINFIWVVKKP